MFPFQSLQQSGPIALSGFERGNSLLGLFRVFPVLCPMLGVSVVSPVPVLLWPCSAPHPWDCSRPAAWSSLILWKVSLPMPGVWNEVIFKIPSTSAHSVSSGDFTVALQALPASLSQGPCLSPPQVMCWPRQWLLTCPWQLLACPAQCSSMVCSLANTVLTVRVFCILVTLCWYQEQQDLGSGDIPSLVSSALGSGGGEHPAQPLLSQAGDRSLNSVLREQC